MDKLTTESRLLLFLAWFSLLWNSPFVLQHGLVSEGFLPFSLSTEYAHYEIYLLTLKTLWAYYGSQLLCLIYGQAYSRIPISYFLSRVAY